MSTTIEATSTLLIGIDLSVFHEAEQKLVNLAVQRGDIEHLAAIINEVTPEKADVIAQIQNKLRPKTFVFDSNVQAEAEAWMATNTMTPEAEKEWQAKIDAEKEQQMKQAGITPDLIKSIDTSDQKNVKMEVYKDLSQIKGLGDASVKKLIANGIDSVAKYQALSEEEIKKILSPVVVANLLKNE